MTNKSSLIRGYVIFLLSITIKWTINARFGDVWRNFDHHSSLLADVGGHDILR